MWLIRKQIMYVKTLNQRIIKATLFNLFPIRTLKWYFKPFKELQQYQYVLNTTGYIFIRRWTLKFFLI